MSNFLLLSDLLNKVFRDTPQKVNSLQSTL